MVVHRQDAQPRRQGYETSCSATTGNLATNTILSVCKNGGFATSTCDIDNCKDKEFLMLRLWKNLGSKSVGFGENPVRKVGGPDGALTILGGFGSVSDLLCRERIGTGPTRRQPTSRPPDSDSAVS